MKTKHISNLMQRGKELSSKNPSESCLFYMTIELIDVFRSIQKAKLTDSNNNVKLNALRDWYKKNKTTELIRLAEPLEGKELIKSTNLSKVIKSVELIKSTPLTELTQLTQLTQLIELIPSTEPVKLGMLTNPVASSKLSVLTKSVKLFFEESSKLTDFIASDSLSEFLPTPLLKLLQPSEILYLFNLIDLIGVIEECIERELLTSTLIKYTKLLFELIQKEEHAYCLEFTEPSNVFEILLSTLYAPKASSYIKSSDTLAGALCDLQKLNDSLDSVGVEQYEKDKKCIVQKLEEAFLNYYDDCIPFLTAFSIRENKNKKEGAISELSNSNVAKEAQYENLLSEYKYQENSCIRSTLKEQIALLRKDILNNYSFLFLHGINSQYKNCTLYVNTTISGNIKEIDKKLEELLQQSIHDCKSFFHNYWQMVLMSSSWTLEDGGWKKGATIDGKEEPLSPKSHPVDSAKNTVPSKSIFSKEANVSFMELEAPILGSTIF